MLETAKMTRKTRTTLFLICLFLFLLITPWMLFYSKGYRFDFDSRKIVQTGGLFLRTQPRNTEVYLNEKLRGRTDFFFGSVLIRNLLPRKHKIEVKKEGFHPWKKTLEIREKEVVAAKNIILFPENPYFTALNEKVERFWFSPDQKKIILKETNEAGWSLNLYNLDKNVKSYLVRETDVSKIEADLLSLEFSENSKEISLEIRTAEQIKYFVLEIDEIPPVLTEGKAPLPPPENIITYQKINNNIYYLNNSGHLFKNEEKLTINAFPVKPGINYALKIFGNSIFLQEEKTLYQLNPDSRSFEKLFEKILGLKISPDSREIAYFSNYEIWILFLAAEETQKKAERQLFLTRVSEKIDDIFWLNSHYLIFNSGGQIKIIEIDNRDRINIVNLAQFREAEIFWNKTEKKLYVLSEGVLYVSSVLLP